MTQPNSKPTTAYEPRDSVFFLTAMCMLAAALTPKAPSRERNTVEAKRLRDLGKPEAEIDVATNSDLDLASTTATTLARLLDGGGAPDGYIIPSALARINIRREFEELQAIGQTSGGMMQRGQRASTAAEIERARKRLDTFEAANGKIPDETTIKSESVAALARLADVSEPVRSAALYASVARIAANDAITGARLDDAMGVVVDEMLRAIGLADKLGVPSNRLAEDSDPTPADFPYPANMAAAVAFGIADDVQSSLDGLGKTIAEVMSTAASEAAEKPTASPEARA